MNRMAVCPNMLLLGIESSCDETSVAVVENGRSVLSNVVSSQVSMHAPYGGVVPEIASRQHVRTIVAVTDEALARGEVRLDAIDAIAVTCGPGLAGALLVGVNFAHGLAAGRALPLYGVNHLDGHIHSLWLSAEEDAERPPELPLLVLIVSGGHTQLVLMHDHGEYDIVGKTRDDAAGEAFDKVARLLGLPYPGGPSVSQAALASADPVPFPRAWLRETYDFSFSGLKTAVLQMVYQLATGEDVNALRGRTLPRIDVSDALSPEQIANVAAGFEQSVVDVLVTKTVKAASDFGARTVAVVGGVAANRALRERMMRETSLPVRLSAPQFSTDNAAMIAASAFWNPRLLGDADVHPSLALTSRMVLSG